MGEDTEDGHETSIVDLLGGIEESDLSQVLEVGLHTQEIAFPCTHTDTVPYIVIVFTAQIWIGPDREGHAPIKRCVKCHSIHPAPTYLKRGKVNARGYLVITDSPLCTACEPREAIPMHVDDKGRLRMRIEMRDERGCPYRWYDESWHDRSPGARWRSFLKLGMRRMDPNGNVIRCQPRANRHASLDGKAYGT